MLRDISSPTQKLSHLFNLNTLIFFTILNNLKNSNHYRLAYPVYNIKKYSYHLSVNSHNSLAGLPIILIVSVLGASRNFKIISITQG